LVGVYNKKTKEIKLMEATPILEVRQKLKNTEFDVEEVDINQSYEDKRKKLIEAFGSKKSKLQAK
jgi:hypothetical protein